MLRKKVTIRKLKHFKKKTVYSQHLQNYFCCKTLKLTAHYPISQTFKPICPHFIIELLLIARGIFHLYVEELFPVEGTVHLGYTPPSPI